MRNIASLFIGVLVLAGLARAESSHEQSVVLDRFHQAAATADLEGYLVLLTPDVVFLGTDGNERWQGQAFRQFVSENFSAGRGWRYSSVERAITVSPDSRTAWFDEILHNDDLGQCRGSGVLVKTSAGWKIAQYNLSVPVPNELVLQVVAEIAVLKGRPVPAAPTVQPVVEQVGAPDSPPDMQESVLSRPAGYCSHKRHKTNSKAGC